MIGMLFEAKFGRDKLLIFLCIICISVGQENINKELSSIGFPFGVFHGSLTKFPV